MKTDKPQNDSFPPRKTVRAGEEGYAIIEALVAVGLFAIIATGITMSTMVAIDTRNLAAHQSTAMQLALAEMENFAALDPSTLSDANDSITTVTQAGMAFTRTVNVTQNGDGSRTIAITMVAQNEEVGGSAAIVNTFSLWGSQ